MIDKALKLYLSESNRQKEERYLRMITSNYKNRLMFSKNTCTDGNLVEINPTHEFIKNKKTIKTVMKKLNVEKELLDDDWVLIKSFSRGSIAHEGFHIIFTDFNILKQIEKEFSNKSYFHKQMLYQINNIVEDSFIEIAGINYFNGLEFYIEFSNYLALYSLPTLTEVEKKVKDSSNRKDKIHLYLHWAMMYAIIGETRGTIKDKMVKEKIKKTRTIFRKARKETNAQKRYNYVKEIYEEIKNLISEAEQNNNTDNMENIKPGMPQNQQQNGGSSSNAADEVEIKKDFKNRGKKSNDKSKSSSSRKDDSKEKNKEQKDKEENTDNTSSDKKTDLKQDNEQDNQNKKNNTSNKNNEDIKENDNNKNDLDQSNNQESDKQDEKNKREPDDDREQEKLKELFDKLNKEKDEVEKAEQKREKEEAKEREIEAKEDRVLSNIKHSDLNKHMRIKVIKDFYISDFHKRLYYAYADESKKVINRTVNQIRPILENQEAGWETKLDLGHKLNTRNIADKKRRIWMSKKDNREVADLCIEVLIDGSGSMKGRLDKVIKASVTLYEIAKKLNIPISFVEERALYYKPIVEHKLLVDFRNYRKENTKFNLMSLDAHEGTREGVSLKWAHKYQSLQPQKDKLMIVLADGNPQHFDNYSMYNGKDAFSDTKKFADKISRDGTILAIALTKDCYPNLKQIYKNTLLCDNLNKLPGQLARILKQNIFKDGR
ncbi:MAG: hypothetical protein ACOCRX_01960 [Candidatus Woesearchaeota archaeon]